MAKIRVSETIYGTIKPCNQSVRSISIQHPYFLTFGILNLYLIKPKKSTEAQNQRIHDISYQITYFTATYVTTKYEETPSGVI